MTFTAIVLAAGEGKRWGNYTGVPKHLISIDGETLIERTVRQVRRYADKVYVVSSDSTYQLQNAELFIPKQEYIPAEIHKFTSSRSLWSEQTLLLFGDAYYTDEAISIIAQDTNDFTFLLRSEASSFTQKKYGEIYALAFNESAHPQINQALDNLLNQQEVLHAGGWHLLKVLVGLNNKSRNKDYLTKGHFIEIDDWTEDFDYPIDLDRWLEAKARL